ncbi:MAG: hypothetical protein ACF8R7_07945 [Phycisphaerales bacterium JB039]
MITCAPDNSIARVRIGDFEFPLGVYPIEPLQPAPGYRVDFEPADAPEAEDDSGEEWEEWPDRYVYDIVISAGRVQSLVRALLTLMPGRIYPILDVLGQDAYREVDPYIAYHPVGLERLMDGVRRFGAFLFEDGLCGFGAISEEPFYYVFVDEHKIVTVRAEASLKDRVERTLAAFDLGPLEEPIGVDSAAHEHRGVLTAPESNPQLLTSEEVAERLIDAWRLTLNIDPDTNVDDQGRELGPTFWRCLVRSTPDTGADPLIGPRGGVYWELLLVARNWREAEELSFDAIDSRDPAPSADGWPELVMLGADRVTAQQLEELTEGKLKAPSLPRAGRRIISVRRLEQ